MRQQESWNGRQGLWPIRLWPISETRAAARHRHRSVFRKMRLADLVQDFRQPAVVARLVQKMRGSESNRGILVFRQVVVRQHDDARLELCGGERAHDAETGA